MPPSSVRPKVIPQGETGDEQNLDYAMFDPSSISHDLFGEVLTIKPGDVDSFTIEEPPQFNYQSLFEPEALEKKPRWRMDVHRRKMLRIVKKFYYELFKYHNDRLFNTRLTRISSSISLSALEEF